MAVVGFIVGGWRAVQAGDQSGCRGVAVVDSVDGWCRAVRSGVGDGIVDGECLAVQVGSSVSCRVMLIVGIIGGGRYLVR